MDVYDMSYKGFVNECVGEEILTDNISANNPIVGAIASGNNFETFKNNFKARLQRLRTQYKNGNWKEIKVQIKGINTLKWQGSSAELAAYDYIAKLGLTEYGVRLNYTFDNALSYAGKMGKSKSNLDIYSEDLDLYIDVKSFKDNVDEIFEGIIKEIRNEHLEYKNVLIKLEGFYDSDCTDIRSNRNQVKTEILQLLNEHKDYGKSCCITDFSYRLSWGNTLIAEGVYNPYRFAQEIHKQVFYYVNKFVKKSPTVLIFVNFPWYNKEITDRKSNPILYRAIARRIFVGYLSDNRPFRTFNSEFSGEETISQITKKISGLIFLDDESITSNDTNACLKAYTYLNPNADNSLINGKVEDILNGANSIKGEHDNFLYDNYPVLPNTEGS